MSDKKVPARPKIFDPTRIINIQQLVGPRTRKQKSFWKWGILFSVFCLTTTSLAIFLSRENKTVQLEKDSKPLNRKKHSLSKIPGHVSKEKGSQNEVEENEGNDFFETMPIWNHDPEILTEENEHQINEFLEISSMEEEELNRAPASETTSTPP
jgi:hypothetical protein